MAKHLSLVNQKLGFAKAVLAHMEQSTDLAPASILMSALHESVLLHLFSAYHFYLRELADINGVKNAAAIDSLDSLQAALTSLNKRPVEVAELAGLSADPFSWLGRMLGSHAQIFEPPAMTKRSEKPLDNLIDVVDLIIEEEKFLPNAETFRNWTREFTALVLRHRETSAEY